MPGALDRLIDAQRSITQWQDDLYTHFHSHPELGFAEHETHDRIAAELDKLDGVEVERSIGETGVAGVLRNGEGPTILMRADIDALPVKEQTGLDYASTVEVTSADGEKTPVMHACGHDVHISALLGATRLLAEHTDAWSGTFVALFQPAEERGGGAQKMVDDALTERIPEPEVAFAQHVVARPAGEVSARVGITFSTASSMRITVYGRGGHGSMPHTTVDPVVLAAMIVLRLQTIVSRETQPGEFAVVTVGRLSAGSKVNIISDRAELLVNVRAYDDGVMARVLKAIERIVRAECEASGSPKQPDIELFDEFPLTVNDQETTERVQRAFTAAFGDDLQEQPAASASEDFSVIPDAFGVPYCYWTVGGMDRDRYADAVERDAVREEIPGNHSPFFAPVMHPTLEAATKAILVVALDRLPKAG